jgi:hypothetical protein
MTDWEGDLADVITAGDDENPADASQITLTLPLPPILMEAPKIFFRIETEE